MQVLSLQQCYADVCTVLHVITQGRLSHSLTYWTRHTETNLQPYAMKEARTLRKSSEDATACKHRLRQRIHDLEHKLQPMQEALLTAQRQR